VSRTASLHRLPRRVSLTVSPPAQGLENEFSSLAEAKRRTYVRQRQILQWAFMAAPHHPAMQALCDTLAKQATAQFHVHSIQVAKPILDTLERTGPGLFTDIMAGWVRR
jgi:hypothetical protein